MTRDPFKPRDNQLLPGGRAVRLEDDQINQSESWERRSRDIELVRDDVPHAFMYLSASAATSVTAGTYTKVAGTTALDSGYLVDMPTDNRIRYLGFEKQFFSAHLSATLTSDTNATEVYVRLAKNGSTLSRTQIDHEVSTAADVESVSTGVVIDLERNDYLELWVDTDKNASITFSKLVWLMLPLGRFPVLRVGRGGPR